MTIQPGNGYNFVSSSQGTSLDIDKPWTPPIGDAMVFAPEFVLGNSNLPEQLVYGEGVGGRPSPFECQIVSINGERFLQIGVGAIGYTAGPMPLIKAGAETRIMQAYANKVQICPSGTRTYGDLYPIYPYDDPSYSLTWWMEDGGGYQLADTNDPLTLLFFPFSIRYHALHHLFPSMPYHNLKRAHDHLVRTLPSDSPYHALDRPSWWSVARRALFGPPAAATC